MKKVIELAAIFGLIAFAVLCPAGVTFAAFVSFFALLFGAWARTGGVVLAPFFLTISGFLGLVSVISACIGLAPGSGTLAFGSEAYSFILTLEGYGAGRAEFSIWVLVLTFLPLVVGTLLASWVNRLIANLTDTPGSQTMPA